MRFSKKILWIICLCFGPQVMHASASEPEKNPLESQSKTGGNPKEYTPEKEKKRTLMRRNASSNLCTLFEGVGSK